ncbi:MAG: DUF4276 family protein [Armatimonadota bacterium]
MFLLEEPSMAELLDIVLPRLLPEGVLFQTVPHEGKTDLEKSIPLKLKGWREPDVKFVVVRDNDGADCIETKQRLTEFCSQHGRPDSLVRIVCQELECWYLGDLAAVEKAYRISGLTSQQDKARYRQPDRHINGSQMMRKLVPEFEKISGARTIAPHLNIDVNRSPSFNAFVDGVRRISTS